MHDLIKKHLDDLAAGNWDDYKAALADDVVYEELATRQRAQGGDDYVAAVQRWKRAFPDLKANLKHTYADGDHFIVELEWEGTHGGPLEGPFGTIAATNKRGRTPGVMVFTIKDDKIQEVRHYFDLLTIFSQIGLSPLSPATGAQAKPSASAGARVKHR